MRRYLKEVPEAKLGQAEGDEGPEEVQHSIEGPSLE